jgi:hypothetical protein
MCVAAGCTKVAKATVHGAVTYDGQAVESGFVTFHSEEVQGARAAGEIKNGEYTVENVSLGKNRVEVVASEQQPAPAGNQTRRSREEANAERLGKMKHHEAKAKPSIAKNAVGNNEIWEIGTGRTKLDLTLRAPASR